MKRNAYSWMRRTLLTSLATIVMALMLTMPSSGSGLVPPGGNTEDATVQIACANEDWIAANPLRFTVNYQNEDRNVSYDHNTARCPITDFEGERLAGREGSGNLDAITYTTSDGVSHVIERNEGEVEIQDPRPGCPCIVIIEVWDYSGRLYIEITIIGCE